ncbi:MAG: hypothetical protein KC443_15765 [Anaerolineales bacterium]|nr:hypothetical protein [Anaerolineales bacterium]
MKKGNIPARRASRLLARDQKEMERRTAVNSPTRLSNTCAAQAYVMAIVITPNSTFTKRSASTFSPNSAMLPATV